MGASRRSRRVAIAVAVPFLLAGGRTASDNDVRAVGTFLCFDGSTNQTFPLAGARVEMWDSDCDGSTICDDFMGSSRLDAAGHYDFTGHGGDPFSPPDPYIRVVYNDDAGVRLTDELDSDRSVDTPEHDHDNTAGGTIDFGTFVIGGDVGAGNASKCGVWHAGHDAFQSYVALIGEPPPAGKWDIEYWSGVWSGTPWTNTNTTHWPIHYWSSAATHEFAHSVRHFADGDANHFNWDVTRFRYARNHDICAADANQIATDTHEMGLAFGFNEGWAEFWEGQTGGCGSLISDEIEGNNAWALNQLSRQPGVGKKMMVEVLKAHPGQIHSLDEFAGFLAPSVGVSNSALMQNLADARAGRGTAVQVKQRPIMTAQRMSAAVHVEMTEVQQAIANLRTQLDVATRRASDLPPCVQQDCAKAISVAILPPMLRADLAAKQAFLQRLTYMSSERYQPSVLMARLGGGEDSSFATLVKSQEERLHALYERAFEEAIQALRPLETRSEQARAEVGELTEKLEKLRTARATWSGPEATASQFTFKEDLAARKAKGPQKRPHQ